MKTYAVKYLDGTELQVAYIQGDSQDRVKEEFSKIYPNIEQTKIISAVDINVQSDDYGATIRIAKIMVFLGWASVIIGIIVFLTGMFMLVGISGTIGIITSGLMLVVGGQITRATADTANYTKQMLDEMRNIK